jgi:hypothetical protein
LDAESEEEANGKGEDAIEEMAEEEIEEIEKEGGEEQAEGEDGSESDGSEESDSSDSDNDSDQLDPEQQVDQSELAWNILETARVALANATNPEQKYLLSEIHLALADVALESDHVDLAFGEFQKCIDLRVGLGDQRSIAEVYFFAGIAIQTEKREESLEFVQKAQTILETLAATAEPQLKEELDAILVDVRKRVLEIKDYIETAKKLEEAEAAEMAKVKPDLPSAITDFGTVGGMKKKVPTANASAPTAKKAALPTKKESSSAASSTAPKAKKVRKNKPAKTATIDNSNSNNNNNNNNNNANSNNNSENSNPAKRKAVEKNEESIPNKKKKDEK